MRCVYTNTITNVHELLIREYRGKRCQRTLDGGVKLKNQNINATRALSSDTLESAREQLNVYLMPACLPKRLVQWNRNDRAIGH